MSASNTGHWVLRAVSWPLVMWAAVTGHWAVVVAVFAFQAGWVVQAWLLLTDAKKAKAAQCESCGESADFILGDRSTWCFACHESALANGYDGDLGRRILL